MWSEVRAVVEAGALGDEAEHAAGGAARPVLAELPLAHRLLAHTQLARQLLLRQMQVPAQGA